MKAALLRLRFIFDNVTVKWHSCFCGKIFMRKYIFFLLQWILIFFVGSILIFSVVRLMPTSPVDHYLTHMSLPLTEENRRIIRETMGLDKPLLTQYVTWIGNFIKGDWGTSLASRLDIRKEFMSKMPYSFGVSISGMLLGAVLAYFLGYCGACKRNGIFDHISGWLSIITQTVPGFIVALLIVYFLGVKLRIAKFFTGDGRLAIASAVAIMALYRIGPWARVVRNAFREEMKKSYVKFAISRGIPKKNELFFHACRPVICVLVSAVISDFASVFGASAVLEFAFTIPGLSYFLIRCMQQSDYNVIQSYTLVVIVWMFFVHLVLNLLLDVLDVRRRG